jgi:hypothetical protein
MKKRTEHALVIAAAIIMTVTLTAILVFGDYIMYLIYSPK